MVPAPVGVGGHSVALGRATTVADMSPVMTEYGSVFGGMLVLVEVPAELPGVVDEELDEADVGQTQVPVPDMVGTLDRETTLMPTQ